MVAVSNLACNLIVQMSLSENHSLQNIVVKLSLRVIKEFLKWLLIMKFWIVAFWTLMCTTRRRKMEKFSISILKECDGMSFEKIRSAKKNTNAVHISKNTQNKICRALCLKLMKVRWVSMLLTRNTTFLIKLFTTESAENIPSTEIWNFWVTIRNCNWKTSFCFMLILEILSQSHRFSWLLVRLRISIPTHRNTSKTEHLLHFGWMSSPSGNRKFLVERLQT